MNLDTKRKCEVYHTKVELAINMINFAHAYGLQAEYVTFDTWYSSKALLNLIIVQVKVNNVLYIINLSKNVTKSKQVNDAINEVTTTIWDRLST